MFSHYLFLIPSFFWWAGKSVLRYCGISCVSSLFFFSWRASVALMTSAVYSDVIKYLVIVY